MVKWKLQAVEPDTCEPPGCRYLELWDVEADPLTRVHTVVGFDRVCPAHDDDVPFDKMLWADGHWKDKKAYIEYQRAWFRHQNHKEWLARGTDEPMPATIAAYGKEPQTSGSVTPPAQAQVDGMTRAYGRNRQDNQRKNQVVDAARLHGVGRAEWHFDAERVLHVKVPANARPQVQSLADIQFGQGKVIIE